MPPVDHNASVPPLMKLCEICCTQHPCLELLQPCTCGVHYCSSCLKDRFLLASREAPMMPPSCCDGLIPIHLVIGNLSATEASQYRAKFDEWRSPVKLYCPVPWCSTFIPDRLMPPEKPKSPKLESSVVSKTSSKRQSLKTPSIRRSSKDPELDQVHCPNCRARICVKCKQLCHPQSPCEDFVEHKTRNVLNRLGYKTCPSCGHGLRRMYGCNHMVCFCGAHFCWGCRRPIGQCEQNEECLVDGDQDCADFDAEEQSEPQTRLHEIVEALDDRGEVPETFRRLCLNLLDFCLKDPLLYPQFLTDTTQRRRYLLVALEEIAANPPSSEATESNKHTSTIIQTLGRLARELPDGKGLSDEDALRIFIEVGQSEAIDGPSQNAQGEPEREELVDLDRRDAMERDLDFGMEPDEHDNHFSACEHRFQPYELPKELQQVRGVKEGMECHKCWRKVHLKGCEFMSQGIPLSRLRYSLRSMSQAVACSDEVVDSVAWSCQTCHIMYCGGCVQPTELKL